MAIEAPVSKHRKNNLLLTIVILIAGSAWCAYDGYFHEKWIKDHTDADGNPEAYLVFNRKVPIFCIPAAAVLGAWFLVVKSKKLVADDNALVLEGKDRIAYDCIQAIDKTNFKSKGFFVITYKTANGQEKRLTIDERKYDNLSAILDELVAKIS